MLESVASRVLQRYASAFVEEVRPEDLTLSVLDGVVELRNVRLKPAAVESLSLPVVVESATASFVRLKFPWRALGAEPVEITLTGLVLRVRTKVAADARQSRTPDSAAARDAAHSAKMAALAQLHAAEQAVRSAGAAEGPGGGAGSPSLLARALAWAAHRTHVRVRDVVVDLRHACASGPDLRLRASLDSLALEPAGREDLWEGWFLDGTVAAADAGAVLTSVAKVDGLALSAGAVEGPGRDGAALPVLLEPWGLECVVALCNPMVAAPPPTVGGVGIRVRIVARAAPVALSLRRSQVPALADAAAAVAAYQRHCSDWSRRPLSRPRAGPSACRAWWRYAARAARRHPMHRCPYPRPPCAGCIGEGAGENRAFAGRRARYRAVFLARERGSPPLSEGEAAEARDLEMALPFEALARAQSEARETLAQEREAPAEGPATGRRAAWTWLSRWFGGSDDGDVGAGRGEDARGGAGNAPAPPPVAVAAAGSVAPFLASLTADGVDVVVEEDGAGGSCHSTPLLRLCVGEVQASVAQREGCAPHASLGVASLEAEACEKQGAASVWRPLLRLGGGGPGSPWHEARKESALSLNPVPVTARVDALAAFLAGRVPAEEGSDPLTVALLPGGKVRVRARPLRLTPSLPWLARAGAFAGPPPGPTSPASAAASATAPIMEAVERVRASRAGAMVAGVRSGLDQARQQEVEVAVGGVEVALRASAQVGSPCVVLTSGRLALHRGAGEASAAATALADSTCDPWRARLSVPTFLSVAALSVRVKDGLAPDSGEAPTLRPPDRPLGILVPPGGTHSAAAGGGRETPSRRRRVQWRPGSELEDEEGTAPNGQAQQPAAQRDPARLRPSGVIVEPLDATALLLTPAGDGVEGLPGSTVAARLSPLCATFCAHRRGLVDRWVEAASRSATPPSEAEAAAAASAECAAQEACAALLARLLALPRGAAAVAWPSLSLSVSLPLVQARLMELEREASSRGVTASELVSISLRDLRAVYTSAAWGAEAALSLGDVTAEAYLAARGRHRLLHLAPGRLARGASACPAGLQAANGARFPLQRGAAVWAMPSAGDSGAGAPPASLFVRTRIAAAPGIGLASHAGEGECGAHGADLSLACVVGSLHVSVPCHLLARVTRAATALESAPAPTDRALPPAPPPTPQLPRPLCARMDAGVQLASVRFTAADPSGATVVTASLHSVCARHTAWARGSRTSARLRCVDVQTPDAAPGIPPLVAIEGGSAAGAALTACLEDGRVPSAVTAFQPTGDAESAGSSLAPPTRVKAALGRIALQYRAPVCGDVAMWAAEVAADPSEQLASLEPVEPAPTDTLGPTSLPAAELTVTEVEVRVPCSSGRLLKRSAVVVAVRDVACSTRATRAMAHFRARAAAEEGDRDDEQWSGSASARESRQSSRAASPAASLASSAGSTVFEDAMEDVGAGWGSDSDDGGAPLARFAGGASSDEGSDFEEAGQWAGQARRAATPSAQWYPATLTSEAASAAITLEASLVVSAHTEVPASVGDDELVSTPLLAPVQARATLRQVLDLGATREAAHVALEEAIDITLSRQQFLLLSALPSYNLAEQGPLAAALAARVQRPRTLSAPASTASGGANAVALATARRWAGECGPAGPMDAPNCAEMDIPGLSVRLCPGAAGDAVWRLHAGRISACHRSGSTRASSTAALASLGLDRCTGGGGVPVFWVDPLEGVAASVAHHSHVRGSGPTQRSVSALAAEVGVVRLEAGPEAAAVGAFFDPDPALLPGLGQQPPTASSIVPAPPDDEPAAGADALAVSSVSASLAGVRARLLVPAPSGQSPRDRLPRAFLLHADCARVSAVLAPRGVTSLSATLPGVSVVALDGSSGESVLRPLTVHVRASADVDPAAPGNGAGATLEACVESPLPLVLRLSVRQLVALQRYAALALGPAPQRAAEQQPDATEAGVDDMGAIAPQNPRPVVLDSAVAPVYLTIVNDAGVGPVPLLQARLSRVLATARGDSAYQRITASCSLAVDVHEPKAGRWEPLVEPWSLSVSRCERFGDPIDWLAQAGPRTATGTSGTLGDRSEERGDDDGDGGDGVAAGFFSGDDFDSLRSPPAVTLLAKAHNVADITVATSTANALLAASAELAALQRAVLPSGEGEGGGGAVEEPSLTVDNPVHEGQGDGGVTQLHNCLGRAISFCEVVERGVDNAEWPMDYSVCSQGPLLSHSSAVEEAAPAAGWREVQDGSTASLESPAHVCALSPEACRAAALRVASLCGESGDGADCDPVHDADLAWHMAAAQGTLGSGNAAAEPHVLLLSVAADARPLAVRVGRTGIFAFRLSPKRRSEVEEFAAGAGGAVVVEVATEAGARVVRVRSRLALRNCTSHPLQVRLWVGEGSGRSALARCWDDAVRAWREPGSDTGTGVGDGDEDCVERMVPAGGDVHVPTAHLAATWLQLRPQGEAASGVQWSTPLPCATLAGLPQPSAEGAVASRRQRSDELPEPQHALASPHFLVGCPAATSSADLPWYAVGYRATGRRALAVLRATDATTIGASAPLSGTSDGGMEEEEEGEGDVPVTPLLSVLALVPPCAVDNTLPTRLAARVMRHHMRGGSNRRLPRHVHEGGLATRGLLRLECGELGSLHSLPPPGWAEAHAAAAVAAADSLRRWAAHRALSQGPEHGPVPDCVLPLLYPLVCSSDKRRRRRAKEAFSEVLHACIPAGSVHGAHCAADAVLGGEVVLPSVVCDTQGDRGSGADAAAWGHGQRRIGLAVGPLSDAHHRAPFSVGLSVEGVRTAAGTLLLRVAAPAWVLAHGAAADTDGHRLLVAENSSAGRAAAEGVAVWSGAAAGARGDAEAGPESQWLGGTAPTAARILPMVDPVASRPPPLVATMVAAHRCGAGPGQWRAGRWSSPFSRVAVGAAATVLLRPEAPVPEGEAPFCVHATVSVHMGPGKFSGSRIVRLAPRVLVANRAGQPLWVAAGRESGCGQALDAGAEEGWVCRGPGAEEGAEPRLCVAPGPDGPWSQVIGVDVGQDATLALPRPSAWRTAPQGWVAALGPMAPPAAAAGRVRSARLEDSHSLFRLATATDGATQVLAIHGNHPEAAPYRILNETLGFTLRVRQVGAPREHAVQVSPTEDAEWSWHDPGAARTALVALEPWAAADEAAATALVAVVEGGDAAAAPPALSILGAASAASGVLRTLAAVPGGRRGDEDAGEVAVPLDEAGSETQVKVGTRSSASTTVRLQVRVVGAARVLVATETRTPPGLVISGVSRRLLGTEGWPAHRCSDLLRGDAASLLARPALRSALLGIASRQGSDEGIDRERLAGAIAVGASARALWMQRERSRALEDGCLRPGDAGEESAWVGVLAKALRATGVPDVALPLTVTSGHSLDALRHAGASGPDALLTHLRGLRNSLRARLEDVLAGSRALARALEGEEEEEGIEGEAHRGTVISVLAVGAWDLPQRGASGAGTRLRLRLVPASSEEGGPDGGRAWAAQTRFQRGARAVRWMERVHVDAGPQASLKGAVLEGEVVDVRMGGLARPLGRFRLDASTLAAEAAAAQEQGESLAFTVALAVGARSAGAHGRVPPGPGPRVGLVVGTHPTRDAATRAARRQAMLVALRRSCALVDALRQRLFLLGVPLGELAPPTWIGARGMSSSPLQASPTPTLQLAAHAATPLPSGGPASGSRPLEASLSLHGAQHLPLPLDPVSGTPVEGMRCYAAVRIDGVLRRTTPTEPDLPDLQKAVPSPPKHFKLAFTAQSLGLGLRQTHGGLVVVSRVASDLASRVDPGSAEDATRLQPGCVLTHVRGWDTTCVPMDSVVRWLQEQARPLELGFTEGAAGRRSRRSRRRITSPVCSVRWGERLSVRPVQGGAQAPEMVVTLFAQHPKDASPATSDGSSQAQLLPLLLFFGEAAAVGADESMGASEALHPRDLLLGQLRVPLPCGPEGVGGSWEGAVALSGPASKWGATVQLSVASRPLRLRSHQTTQSRLCVLLPDLSVTLLGQDGREVIHAGVRGVRARSDRTAAGRSMDEVEVESVQVDDQRADAVLPTVLRSLRPRRDRKAGADDDDDGWTDDLEGHGPPASVSEDSGDTGGQQHPYSLSRAKDQAGQADARDMHLVPTLHASAVRLDQAAATHVEMVSLLLQELCVEVDVDFILRLVGVLQEIHWDAASALDDAAPQHALSTAMGQAPLGPRVSLGVPEAEAPGLFVAVLQLQPMKLTVTVAGDVEGGVGALVLPPSPALAPLRAVLDAAGAMLAQVDAAPLRVKALLAEHVCGRAEEVVGRVTRHLTTQLVREAYKVLASAEFLGNPVGLVTGVGAGVVDFFYEPAQGMLENPREMGRGLTRGTTRLLASTAGAVLHSAASLTGTVNRGVASLAMDEEWARQRRQAARGAGPRSVGAGLSAGRESLQRGVWSGVKGVVMDPVRGAKRDGARGAAQGVVRGLLGAVVKPTSGLLDLTTHTLRGLRDTGGRALGAGEGTGRLRLPRYPGAVPAPQRYRARDATGAALALLVGMRGGELYVWHWRDAASDAVLLLTSRRAVVLDLGAGATLWAAPIRHCAATRRGQHLSVERTKPASGVAEALPTLECAFRDEADVGSARRRASTSDVAFSRDERGRGAACLVLRTPRAARAAVALLQAAASCPGPAQLEAARFAMHGIESAEAMAERWGATSRVGATAPVQVQADAGPGAPSGPEPATAVGDSESVTAAVLHRGVLDWLCGGRELRVIGARVRGWELRREQSRGLLGVGAGAREFVAYELAFTAETRSSGRTVEWSVLRRFRHARALFVVLAASARAERSSFPPPPIPGRRLAGSASHDVADIRAGLISAWLAWLVQRVREEERLSSAPARSLASLRDVAAFLTDCAFDVEDLTCEE